METKQMLQKALAASRELNLLSKEKIDDVLLKLADAAVANADEIIEANRKDLERMDKTNPMYDRLLLDRARIEGIAGDIRNVAGLKSPVGEILSQVVRPNGMKITKIRVPFGVVGVIYEARPNVSFDVFSLCFKTSNAAVLKGGSDAKFSNEAIVKIIKNVLEQEGVTSDAVTLLEGREATAQLLDAVEYVDLIIPRGSKSLIEFVRDNSRVPVIETGAGIVHAYFDKSGDLKKGADIVFNAKTRRVSVCNALDTLVINRDRLADLPLLTARLADKNVIIYADDQAYKTLMGKYPDHLLQHATDESFGIEFQDYKISIKTVADIDEAIEHVMHHTSKHSETIITEDPAAAEKYKKNIDAACVYVNVSTAFSDGAQFGMGAEIGISTQKLHARGPMALPELTSYKYIIEGDGQVRP